MAVLTNEFQTLRYDPALCIGCGMCFTVCPHGVFAANGGSAQLVAVERCIECGACARNCPVGAIVVDVGVGCASALIRAALTGGEPTCGPSAACCAGTAACCGSADASCGQPEAGCCAPER